MRYFKRVDEGNHSFGGEATYFLEIDEDGDATRQVEVYPGGQVLRYSASHGEDEHGALAVRPIDGDDDAWAPYAITRDEFERVWKETTGAVEP